MNPDLPPVQARRKLRERMHISRRGAAWELGVCERSVDRWERGAVLPRGENYRNYAELLQKWSRALGEEPSW